MIIFKDVQLSHHIYHMYILPLFIPCIKWGNKGSNLLIKNRLQGLPAFGYSPQGFSAV